MKKFMVPLILLLGFTLCWAASKFTYDLREQAARYSDWNIIGQEYTLALDSNTAFAAMDIPGIDSIRLLSVRCLTLDADGNPYTFRISLNGNDTSGLPERGWITSAFLAINIADSFGSPIPADSVFVGNMITTNPDITLSVYASGEK